jgi:hypothetical protein
MGLSDDDIKRIAEQMVPILITQVKAQQHAFWIEPEQHYLDHIEMREVASILKNIGTIFMKTFIGFFVIGAVIVAAFGIFSGVGD